MTNGDSFALLFKYWCGYLKLREDIDIRKDNRYDCHAAVVDYDVNPYLIYNTKKLAKWPYCFIVCGVLHEIGHLINDLPYKTEKEKIKSEYKAERFALDIMKEHYPKLYKEAIKECKRRMSKSYWKKGNLINYKANMKIKEYK